jgi:hypothetical protein
VNGGIFVAILVVTIVVAVDALLEAYRLSCDSECSSPDNVSAAAAPARSPAAVRR